MADDLTLLSTVADLSACSDQGLRDGLGNVSQETVLEYILQLRERDREHTLGPPIICRAGESDPAFQGELAPATLLEEALGVPPSYETLESSDEQQAVRSRSSRAQIKFTAHFTNRSSGNVDLIWKDYEGKEVLVRQDIRPGVTHGESTYLTHPFLARESGTRKLRKFAHRFITSAVFEGLNFEATHAGIINVTIQD